MRVLCEKKADCPWFNAADEYSFTANVSLFLECVYPFRSKLKKGRTYFKIQGTYFKICRTYFCPRKIGLSGHGWKRAFSCEYIFVFSGVKVNGYSVAPVVSRFRSLMPASQRALNNKRCKNANWRCIVKKRMYLFLFVSKKCQFCRYYVSV